MTLPVTASERSEPRNLALVAVALLCAFAPSSALAAAPPDPSVRLYDTGRRSVLMHPSEVALKKGWTRVAEGVLSHRFTGDPVLANDRLAVVLHRVGQAFACFTVGDGTRRPVIVQPRPHPTGEYVLKFHENSAAAVEVEAADENVGFQAAAFRLRLTAGEPLVTLRAGPGLEKVRLLWEARHTVVPDFFGDDAVWPTEAARRGPIGLPAENVLLAFHGTSILACVWESRDGRADLCPSPHGAALPGADPACVVECREGKRFWLALLDGPGLYDRRDVAEGKTPAAILGAFKPPFPAKWRASFVGTDGVCESITFEQPPEKAPVPETWRGPVIFYPIDRSRTTPLTTILPMDVLRSTLGVGPCEYILDLEGLGGDDPAPPDAVVGWLERLVKKKRAARSAEEIKERLDAMLTHLAAARARINDYAAFGKQIRHVCREAAKQDAEKEAAAAVLRICDRLDHDLARGRAEMKTPADAARLAREIAALIEKPDALTGFAAPGKALRAIGHAFDATLARSRMAARRMKAYSRSQKGGLATTVETMAERRLRRKE